MRISGISFRGYDPYPINGGKIEKFAYETEHGWRDNSSSNNEDCYIRSSESMPDLSDLYPDSDDSDELWGCF